MFCLLGVATALLACVRQVVIAQRATLASTRVHESLLHTMLRAPMSFFHSTPSGNTVARFSKDMNVLDVTLPDLLSDMLLVATDGVVQMVVLAVMQPQTLLFALPTAAANLTLSLRYSRGIGNISRLESSLSSPCYAIFQETLNGLPTVRSIRGGVELVASEHRQHVETLVHASITRQGAIRWLRQRSELSVVLRFDDVLTSLLCL